METIGKRREGKKVGGGEEKAMKNGNLRFDETKARFSWKGRNPAKRNKPAKREGEREKWVRSERLNVMYLTGLGKGMYRYWCRSGRGVLRLW